MKRHYVFRMMLVSFTLLFAFGAYAQETTSTLVFTKQCGGTGTADDDVVWTVTSDAAESAYTAGKGIHYGTGSAFVSYIQLTTSGIQGTIKKIVVNASGASKTTAKLNVTVGDAPFGSEKSLTASNAPYTFEGNATGEIIVKLTQTSAKRALYVKSIAVTYSTELPQGTENPDNSFAEAVQHATIGMPYEIQTMTTKSDGAKNYESSRPDVASVGASGAITLHKAGETVITVNTAQTATYAAGSASYILVVGKGTPVFKFKADNFVIFNGDEKNGPELENPGGNAVTFSIDDKSVAEVSSDGKVKALKAGTAIVTATIAETEAYFAASASYTLVVEEKPTSEGLYEIVNDAATLQVGDKLIFIYQGTALPGAMGPQKTNNFGVTSVVYPQEGNKDLVAVTAGKSSVVTPIVLGGSNGEWTFLTPTGYMCTTGGTSNYLRTQEEDNEYTKASISITDNDATVIFTKTNRLLKYNTSSSLFSLYVSSNTYPLVKIYRKIGDIKVSFANDNEEITFGDSYRVQAANAGDFTGDLVYKSSDDTKVKFHGNHVIDILAPGTVTITAELPQLGYSADYELKINEPSDEHAVKLSFGSAGYLTWVATDNIDFENTEGVTAYQITDATAAGITAQEVAKVP
ncbi:MAG: Ig-like domain-containing protein, partial [Prevotella sp.]|uniref:Ig-like domain-containing protein n=1 Tax=Prevotella sp. TaxID=59823 RepID=UPI002A26C633